MVVTPAVAGPYDLGNVVDRVRVFVDPVTAQITAISDPIPQIMDGSRSACARCRSTSTAPTSPSTRPTAIRSRSRPPSSATRAASATRASGFQVGNCAALPFAPKFSLKLRGSTKRRGHPALHTVVTRNPGEANLKRIVLAMPKNEILDNAHLDTICTRVQFSAHACPAGSVVGSATVDTPLLGQPLTGPVVLRSSSHELPDLVLDLRGQLNIELVGRIDSSDKGGLRATFDSVPDAPFTRAVVDLEGGKKGLLQNSEDLCKAKPEGDDRTGRPERPHRRHPGPSDQLLRQGQEP